LISQAESTAFTACQIASREAASGVAPLLTIVFTPLNQWAGSAGGNWGDAAKWTAATVPNSNTATANFWGNAVSPATVDLQATSRTVKTLSFDNAGNSYTIVSSAGGQLNLAADSGPASVEVLHGSHQIAAAVNLSSPTTLSVANSGDALRLTGDLTGPAADVTKTGPGTVRIENAAGTAALIRSLTISAGAVDIQSGKVVIANKTLAGGMAAVRTQIASAYAGGAWTGAGLTSTAAAADFAANGGSAKFGVGYVNNADPAAGAKTTWQGRAVDSNSLLIQYTYYGDANLDGQVNLTDFGILKLNYGTGSHWYQADFNYDGTVNLFDFGKLKLAYGATPLAAAAATGAVPEPSSLALLAAAALLGGAAVWRRRRAAQRGF
jgi:hypothetical protein